MTTSIFSRDIESIIKKHKPTGWGDRIYYWFFPSKTITNLQYLTLGHRQNTKLNPSQLFRLYQIVRSHSNDEDNRIKFLRAELFKKFDINTRDFFQLLLKNEIKVTSSSPYICEMILSQTNNLPAITSVILKNPKLQLFDKKRLLKAIHLLKVDDDSAACIDLLVNKLYLAIRNRSNLISGSYLETVVKLLNSKILAQVLPISHPMFLPCLIILANSNVEDIKTAAEGLKFAETLLDSERCNLIIRHPEDAAKIYQAFKILVETGLINADNENYILQTIDRCPAVADGITRLYLAKRLNSTTLEILLWYAQNNQYTGYSIPEICQFIVRASGPNHNKFTNSQDEKILPGNEITSNGIYLYLDNNRKLKCAFQTNQNKIKRITINEESINEESYDLLYQILGRASYIILEGQDDDNQVKISYKIDNGLVVASDGSLEDAECQLLIRAYYFASERVSEEKNTQNVIAENNDFSKFLVSARQDNAFYEFDIPNSYKTILAASQPKLLLPKIADLLGEKFQFQEGKNHGEKYYLISYPIKNINSTHSNVKFRLREASFLDSGINLAEVLASIKMLNEKVKYSDYIIQGINELFISEDETNNAMLIMKLAHLSPPGIEVLFKIIEDKGCFNQCCHILNLLKDLSHANIELLLTCLANNKLLIADACKKLSVAFVYTPPFLALIPLLSDGEMTKRKYININKIAMSLMLQAKSPAAAYRLFNRLMQIKPSDKICNLIGLPDALISDLKSKYPHTFFVATFDTLMNEFDLTIGNDKLTFIAKSDSVKQLVFDSTSLIDFFNSQADLSNSPQAIKLFITKAEQLRNLLNEKQHDCPLLVNAIDSILANLSTINPAADELELSRPAFK